MKTFEECIIKTSQKIDDVDDAWDIAVKLMLDYQAEMIEELEKKLDSLYNAMANEHDYLNL